MSENEQKPNSVPSDGTEAPQITQAEETTSSQHFGNAMLAADGQDDLDGFRLINKIIIGLGLHEKGFILHEV